MRQIAKNDWEIEGLTLGQLDELAECADACARWANWAHGAREGQRERLDMAVYHREEAEFHAFLLTLSLYGCLTLPQEAGYAEWLEPGQAAGLLDWFGEGD